MRRDPGAPPFAVFLLPPVDTGVTMSGFTISGGLVGAARGPRPVGRVIAECVEPHK